MKSYWNREHLIAGFIFSKITFIKKKDNQLNTVICEMGEIYHRIGFDLKCPQIA